jgi:hypothetical protein
MPRRCAALAVTTAASVAARSPRQDEGATSVSELCGTKLPLGPSLRRLWCEYDEPPVLDRILETADAYERHLPKPASSLQLRMLEMGVQSGGSVRTWRKYYGNGLHYVGVDLNAGCRRSERAEEKTYIEIGSQTNASFLRGVCARHGPFDIVIDDGGHTPDTILTPLKTLWQSEECMKERSLYVIEDMHVMHYSGHVRRPEALYGLVGGGFWAMHWAYPGLPPKANRYGPESKNGKHPLWGDRLEAVHGYPTIAFFERGHVYGKQTKLVRGTDRLEDNVGFHRGRRMV